MSPGSLRNVRLPLSNRVVLPLIFAQRIMRAHGREEPS
jgi:hypothetical protein